LVKRMARQSQFQIDNSAHDAIGCGDFSR
jgi:hypothetical protein